MPQFIQIPWLTEETKKYDPMIASYSIGQRCRTCNQKVLHPESITVCTCYRYCHEKCMLLQMNRLNIDKDEFNYQCISCKKILNVHYKMEVLTKPHVNKFNVLLLIIAFSLLPLVTYFAVIYQFDMVKQILCTFLIFLLLTTIGYALINSLLVRQFTAISIKSTQLGLIISAFVELEKDIEQQMTQTEMLR